MPEWIVAEPHAGERLDRYLAHVQVDLSRSRLQELIRDGRVRVNARPRRASHRLRGGDRVEVELPAARVTTLEPEPIPLAIVHEDADLFVIDKPAGLVVHPGAGVARGTLVHGLLHRDPAIAPVGGEGRPGIVHRLDRDTSGLMVVARTPRAYRALVEAMRQRRVTRIYRTLVWGDPRDDAGIVDAAIGRDPVHRKRMAVVARGGRPARTRWTVRRRFGLAAELEVRLDTGRTHQIRVHLAHLRHPVVGDSTYGGRRKNLLSLAEPRRSLAGALLGVLARHALHAAELAFAHPVTGESLRFRSPLPDDMNHAIEMLEAPAGPSAASGPP